MDSYTLQNANGVSLRVIPFGGIVTEINVPDREGTFADIALGFSDLDGYKAENPYFGALIGRVGNRIRNGRFSLDGKEITLATNDGPNHLHGGLTGFDKADWAIDEIEPGAALRLRYESADGEEGYPGKLSVEVNYRLTDDSEWIVEYRATTDRPTVVNLTQHSYFNLAGHDSGDVLGHELRINADEITPVCANMIPTGAFDSVEGTPFDFRSFKRIGKDIDSAHEQIVFGAGFDHNYVLRGEAGSLRHAATVCDPESGRTMEVHTSEAGMQFYSGNHLHDGIVGKTGTPYRRRGGFCLETQGFPDAPNKERFPSIRLEPGSVYETKTVYKFGVR